ncbi:MAG: PDZ domain-containing protein, partial [Longimicrobiales bacterium]
PWSLRPPDAFDSGDGPPDRRGLRPGAPPDAPPRRRPPRPYSLGYEFVAGARVVALNDPLAEYFEVDRGVLTVDVLDGSPAQEAGLRPGDVIVAVGDEPVASVEDLRTILLGPRGRSVELEIVRQGEERRIRLPS